MPLLTVRILRVEKKPSLSLLSVGSSSGSVEGSGNRQMTPELLSETFAVKAILWHLVFDVQTRYVADYVVIDRQTDRTTTVTLQCMRQRLINSVCTH